MNDKCDCSICENHEYSGSNRMNINETKQYIQNNRSMLDKRKCLSTFYNYCPFCGIKLNWVKIKKDCQDDNCVEVTEDLWVAKKYIK